MGDKADMILHNGKIATLEKTAPMISAVAIKEGRFIAAGNDREIMNHKGDQTQIIDLNQKTAIPGLNDSHTHVIRGGLYYNMELRWDGVPSVADALRMLKEQAQRTPAPQWVRVIGGWSEFQFAEKRMPTLQEINEAAPDTPVFILHLYARALLNRAALKALGMDKTTPNPPGGLIEKDRQGNPTGLFIAEPNALILYSTIARAPKLSFEDQMLSSRHFMRELNRLGVTSVTDAGGGGQNYPADYAVVQELSKRGHLSLRMAYNLFAQKPGEELNDYKKWVTMTKPGEGDDYLRMNGAGENLVWSAADFENFLQPRPDLRSSMENDLYGVIKVLAENRWPFRIHSTYDESIQRFLNVFEKVNREVPFNGMRWFFDHAETISEQSIDRVKALGGGIAIQHRMAYQGEYFIRRYGIDAVKETPPIKKMLAAGVPVGGGTDATRVASYNPWVGLYWLVSGKTVGGTPINPENSRLGRMEALRLYTEGSAWFSSEEGKKGKIAAGQFADLVVLSSDYFSIPEEKIKTLESELTILGGKPVYGTGPFKEFNPPALPVSPDWSPVGKFGGYAKISANMSGINHECVSTGMVSRLTNKGKKFVEDASSHWLHPCDCFAF